MPLSGIDHGYVQQDKIDARAEPGSRSLGLNNKGAECGGCNHGSRGDD
jgi:hypothetical protein